MSGATLLSLGMHDVALDSGGGGGTEATLLAAGAFMSAGTAYSLLSIVHKIESSVSRILKAFHFSSWLGLVVGAAAAAATQVRPYAVNDLTMKLCLSHMLWSAGTPIYIRVTSLLGAGRGSVACSGYTAVPVLWGVLFLKNHVTVPSLVGVILSAVAVGLSVDHHTVAEEEDGVTAAV